MFLYLNDYKYTHVGSVYTHTHDIHLTDFNLKLHGNTLDIINFFIDWFIYLFMPFTFEEFRLIFFLPKLICSFLNIQTHWKIDIK